MPVNSRTIAMQIGNLFADASSPVEGERFETLLAHRNLVIERIVSSASVTPVEYVQPQDEWVVLFRGEAVMKVESETITLRAGDHLFLPAGTPHSVMHAAESSLWLAVHLHGR